MRDAYGNRVVGGYESNNTIMTATLVDASAGNSTSAVAAASNSTAEKGAAAQLTGASATSKSGLIIFNNLVLTAPAGLYQIEFKPNMPAASLSGSRLLGAQKFLMSIRVRLGVSCVDPAYLLLAHVCCLL